jgi:hypothetical protein
MSRLLISGCEAVVTMDDAGTELSGGSILLEDGVIRWVGVGVAPAAAPVRRRRAGTSPAIARRDRLTGLSAPSAAERDGAVSIPDRNPSALPRRSARAESRIHRAGQEVPTE